MARALWKGTLGFGLVNVGVELLSASSSEEKLDLDMLDKRDHARIGYQKINKVTGEVVDSANIVKGFKVGDDEYVILNDADLKAANPRATQSIDIVGFVPQSSVPRTFYDRPYYVTPQKGSERAYALLRDALADTDQLALAQLVLHTRQRMAAVYAYEEALVVQLLRYGVDLKDPVEAGVRTVPSLTRSTASRELDMAKQLIGTMTMDWNPDEFRDTYRDDVLKMVHELARQGGKPSPAGPATSTKQTKVLDLVSALKKSLESPTQRTATRASVRRVARVLATNEKTVAAPRTSARKTVTRNVKKGKVA